MQVLPTLVLGCLLIRPTAVPAQQGERYTLDGDEVAIYNLAGSLTVDPGTGAVSVGMVRGGADAAKLRVERGELDGRETLRVVYPAESIVYSGMERGSSTTLEVREDGTFGDGDSREHHRGRKVRMSGQGKGLRAHADYHVVGRIGGGTGRVAIETGSGDVRLLRSPN